MAKLVENLALDLRQPPAEPARRHPTGCLGRTSSEAMKSASPGQHGDSSHQPGSHRGSRILTRNARAFGAQIELLSETPTPALPQASTNLARGRRHAG